MSESLTREHSQRYDRQVRIWGAEAQIRLQKSKVFVSGLRGLNVEVIKNLVLMGVNMTIHDSSVADISDLSYNFFMNENSIGSNLAEAVIDQVRELNSFAIVDCDTRYLSSLDDTYFHQFNVVVYGGWNEDEALRLNSICRNHSNRIGFFWSGIVGNDGWFISDFGRMYSYKCDPPNDKDVMNGSSFSLSDILERKWSSFVLKRTPIPKVYIKSRLLSLFRQLVKHYDISEFLEEFLKHSSHLLSNNDISFTNEISDSPTAITRSELIDLVKLSTCVPIMPCSVLGSFLAQEIVKFISQTGKPCSCVFLFDGSALEVRSFPNDLVL